MLDAKGIRCRYEALVSYLDERGRRLFAAAEARAAGRGGIALVSEITGIAPSTIGRGLAELDGRHPAAAVDRVRRRGGGRKPATEKQPGLLAALKSLVEPVERGELAGREPEDFETITRRIVATRPEAVRTVGNKLKAIKNFMKIPLAAKIDPDAIERRRDHVLLESPTFVRDSQVWREKHDPDAGYIPDRPGNGDNPVSLVREAIA